MDGYYVELGGRLNNFFTRNDYIKKDKNYVSNIMNFATKRNNTDIYKSIYSYETLNVNDCLLKAPLYIDLDMNNISDEMQFEKLKSDLFLVHSYLTNTLKVPKESIATYFSGNKGFHITVPSSVFGIDSSYALNEEYKLIAINANRHTIYGSIDTSIYDRRRLLRLVNSRHEKTKLYKVSVDIEKVREMEYKDMYKYASFPKPQIRVSDKYKEEATLQYQEILSIEKERQEPIRNKNFKIKKTDKLLPCVVSVLTNGVSKGARNSVAVATASSLLQTGKSEEEVLEILLEWNTINDPPLQEQEIKSVVRSAYKMLLNDRGYGCSFFMAMDLCIPTCEIRKELDKNID